MLAALASPLFARHDRRSPNATAEHEVTRIPRRCKIGLAVVKERLTSGTAHVGQIAVNADPQRLAVRAVLENTGVLIVVFDATGRIVLCNPGYERVLGWPAAEVVGRPFWEVHVLPTDVPHAQAALTRQMTTGRAEIREADAMTSDGGLRRINWHNSLLLTPAGKPEFIVYTGIDVTERRQAEAQLRQRAESDHLTGLLNRAALLDALEQRHVGVLYVDLDGFKRVNDTHGHAAGDEVLVEVAHRLRAVVRDHDLVARIGGDEFVVLCPTNDTHVLDRVAERIRDTLTRPLRLPPTGVQVQVTASVGLAVRLPGEPAQTALAAADAAMYRAKLAARGRTPVTA